MSCWKESCPTTPLPARDLLMGSSRNLSLVSFSRKAKLVQFHIHARSAKCDLLHAQSKSLFGSIFSAQFDCATHADHAVPWQSRDLLKQAHDLTRSSRPARGLSHGAIAGNLPFRQGADHAHHASALIHRRDFLVLVWGRSFCRFCSFRHFYFRHGSRRHKNHVRRNRRSTSPMLTRDVNLESSIQKFTQGRLCRP
jgi:hypothetical protein